MVENRPEEHFHPRPGRVVERDDLLGIAVPCLVLGQNVDGDTRLLDLLTHPLQGELVAHLPPHGQSLVLLAGQHDQSGTPLVESQVQAVRLGAGTHRHAQPVHHQFAPARHVRRLDPEVAESSNVCHGESLSWGRLRHP